MHKINFFPSKKHDVSSGISAFSKDAEGFGSVAPTTERRAALIVDDNVDAAKMLSFFLEALGFQVAIEHHPIEALTRAQEEVFDVFVLDIGLPEIDGHELARRLLARPGCETALFIALTGYGTAEDRRKSQIAGFHHHFVKPADIQKFLKVLNIPGCTQ